jgi:hypothetical protein
MFCSQLPTAQDCYVCMSTLTDRGPPLAGGAGARVLREDAGGLRWAVSGHTQTRGCCTEAADAAGLRATSASGAHEVHLAHAG